LKRLRRIIISILVIIVVFVISNLIFSVFITDEGLEQSSAAFAGNQGVDIVDSLASNSLIHILVTGFNIILGILFLYSLIRLIITSIALYKEHRMVSKIIKEEL
jgi:preprotein translocase subunit SecG